MGTRTAISQSKTVTFGLLFAVVWTAAILVDVATSVEWFAAGSGNYVGQSATAGIVGAVVLVVTLGIAIVLYAATGEVEPSPDPWPPE